MIIDYYLKYSFLLFLVLSHFANYNNYVAIVIIVIYYVIQNSENGDQQTLLSPEPKTETITCKIEDRKLKWGLLTNTWQYAFKDEV